jgi:hypothetical protein
MPNKHEDKFVIVHIEGGLGKHIAATAVIRGVKKKHPDRKLVLVCAYPQVFLYNPDIYRVYTLGVTPYFYDDYIDGKDVIIYKQEPYNHTAHIKQEQSLIKSWFEVFGLKYDGEMPQIYSNYRMLEIALEKWRRNKPILVLHTNGGPYQNNQNNSYNPANIKSWSRDIPTPTAEAIIQHYGETHHIFQICKTRENILNGTEAIVDPAYNLELFSLLRFSDKRILIDSSLQHAAAALQIPSTVLWNGTNPKVFGYEMHQNILPNKKKMEGFKNINAYLYDFELWGDPIQCPWDSNDFYDVGEIITKTDSIKLN